MARGEGVEVLADWPSRETGLSVLRPPPAGFPPKKVKALTGFPVERFGTIRL